MTDLENRGGRVDINVHYPHAAGFRYTGTIQRVSVEPLEDTLDEFLSIDAIVSPRGSVPPTDARRLALAVLDGDEQAALALADEVQMAFQQGEKFISRTRLQGLIEEMEKEIQGLQRELFLCQEREQTQKERLGIVPGWNEGIENEECNL